MAEAAFPAETLAAKAWDAWSRGDTGAATRLAYAAWTAVEHRPRRERQHVQVICLAVAGDVGRARALASEHLAEFPDDELVRVVRDIHRGA
jgi:hypothetical protein